MSKLPSINPKTETEKITKFIKQTLKEQKFENVVIGISGGIDSATNLFLLKNALPSKNIFAFHLPYFENHLQDINVIFQSIKFPKENTGIMSIKDVVNTMYKELQIANNKSQSNQVRIGNVMARVRMIFLYDLARRYNALVVGTENKSEDLLGYFTRFGDAASDIEPIQHLYKTQVFELAKYLGVPKEIIKKSPSANLWEGQTDEGEFGFTYQEADQVLYLYFEQKQSVEEIIKQGFPNAKKIIDFSLQNSYKHQTPYKI